MASIKPERRVMITTVIVMAAGLGACSQAEITQVGKNIYDYVNPQNSFLNPSEVGRFDAAKPWGWSKPVTWAILDNLDMSEMPVEHWTTATDPLPSDMIVETKEYVVGEGDILNISVFELVTPGMPYNDQKTVNELGNVTLQNLGQVHVAGLTPSEIEKKLADLAVKMGFLLKAGNGSQGPQVAVQLYQSRARIFSVLGQVSNPGTYNIIGINFRLLDALALARDIMGGNQPGMDYLYVIRSPRDLGVIPASQPATSPEAAPETAPSATPATTNPLKAIEGAQPGAAAPAMPAPPVAANDGPRFVRPLPQVLTLADIPQSSSLLAQASLDAAISGGTTPVSTPATLPSTTPARTLPADLGQAVSGAASKPTMINVNGRWIEATPTTTGNLSPAEAQAAASGMTMPRVIRIPINKLKEGIPGYNIIIQAGDIINVPNIEPGEFYLMGHINRPGVYTLTGRKVTLKQAIAAAGGLDALAIPRRCDLIRRWGNTETTAQVDLQRIFEGEQPDIYLKTNDLVNVGTDVLAPILAVTRNAYRMSYGWGFTYDRNFYIQPTLTLSSQASP
jgi:polysaccharide biosynthesis/export protein